MKFYVLLFFLRIVFGYSIHQVSEERINWMERRKPHPYDVCLKLIELESKGYDLGEYRKAQVFLFKCANKYGLERQDVAMRVKRKLLDAARGHH